MSSNWFLVVVMQFPQPLTSPVLFSFRRGPVFLTTLFEFSVSSPISLLSPWFFFRDTLNTPFFGNEDPEFAANGALPSDYPYAPIPNEYSGEGDGTVYKWPLPGSEGYYSLMYTGEH